MRTMSAGRHRANPLLPVLTGSLILLVYSLVYLLEPLGDLANQLILGTLTLAASALVSIYASLVYRLLLPGDAPRAVWRNFAIGFWLWTIAEFLWILHSLSLGAIGGADAALILARLFWFVAYFFFSIALYRQHRIMATPRHARGVWVVFAIWGGLIAATLVTMWAMDESLDFLTFLQDFSGFANLAVGILGVSMLIAFQGGALAWPWWGFVGLAISDIVYAVLNASMGPPASPGTVSIPELISELIYLASYLVLGFGFYKHYLLLQHGPRLDEPATRPPGSQTP